MRCLHTLFRLKTILSKLCFCTLLLSLPSIAAPIQVIAEPVRQVLIQDKGEALGSLRANESVEITANVTETITAIHFVDGQSVKVNDVLIETTSAEETALLLEADTNVKEAQRQLERIKQLATLNNASQSVLDQRQRDYSAAKARLAAIKSRLSDRIITAPFAGTLGLRNVSLGALVRPGDLITTLTDNSAMKLDFNLPAIFLPSVSPGVPVVATSPIYPGQMFTGQVSSIDNQIDPVTRTITVRALLSNDQDKLKQGMFMHIDVLMNERRSLLIPEEALLPQGRANFVMVADNTGEKWVAKKTEVSIAQRSVGKVEIITGLKEGQLVITHGAFKVSSGKEIIVQNSAEQDQERGLQSRE